MNFKRVKTIMLHAWYHLNHSVETWIDVFWFPLIHTVVFGAVAYYFSQGGNKGQTGIILLGILLWEILEMGNYSIAIGALWEIWSQSFTSLFVTPLKLSEFVVGHILFGIAKQLGLFFILSLVAFYMFHFAIWQLGWMLIFYIPLLAFFSWAFGMFVLGLLFRYGTIVQSLAWGLIYILQPFAAVYYPVEILPSSIRWLSFLLPPTYIFEAARIQLLTGDVNVSYLWMALLLDVVYVCLSALFLKFMWAWSKRTGVLVRMEQ